MLILRHIATPAYAPRLPVPDIHLDHAARASFDCKDRTPCTERTRIDVIEKINTWTGLYFSRLGVAPMG